MANVISIFSVFCKVGAFSGFIVINKRKPKNTKNKKLALQRVKLDKGVKKHLR